MYVMIVFFTICGLEEGGIEMKKGYETPIVEKISLESKEVVCATNFYDLFKISSGNGTVTTHQQVFDWSNKQ